MTPISDFKPKRLFIVVLRAEDVTKTAHFYRDVLGLQRLPHHAETPAFFVGDGVHLLIRRGKPALYRDVDPFPVIAFEVDNLDEAIKHLKAKGVILATDVVANPRAKYVMFHDPAGNLLEFAEIEGGVDSLM